VGFLPAGHEDQKENPGLIPGESRQMLSDVACYQVQEKLQTVSGVGQITLNGSFKSQHPHLAPQRSRPEDIGAIPVRAQSGHMVPLSLVVTQKESSVLQAISRVDRERAISISGNVAPGRSQAEAMRKVSNLKSRRRFPYQRSPSPSPSSSLTPERFHKI
jgi:multidrug efflux pump subunit AcrB